MKQNVFRFQELYRGVLTVRMKSILFKTESSYVIHLRWRSQSRVDLCFNQKPLIKDFIHFCSPFVFCKIYFVFVVLLNESKRFGILGELGGDGAGKLIHGGAVK